MIDITGGHGPTPVDVAEAADEHRKDQEIARLREERDEAQQQAEARGAMLEAATEIQKRQRAERDALRLLAAEALGSGIPMDGECPPGSPEECSSEDCARCWLDAMTTGKVKIIVREDVDKGPVWDWREDQEL